MTEPDEEEEEEEEEALKSGQSEKEEEGDEEDDGEQEEQAEARPPAAALDGQNVQVQGSSILNKCILIALVVAISMGFGHFHGMILLTRLIYMIIAKRSSMKSPWFSQILVWFRLEMYLVSELFSVCFHSSLVWLTRFKRYLSAPYLRELQSLCELWTACRFCTSPSFSPRNSVSDS